MIYILVALLFVGAICGLYHCLWCAWKGKPVGHEYPEVTAEDIERTLKEMEDE